MAGAILCVADLEEFGGRGSHHPDTTLIVWYSRLYVNDVMYPSHLSSCVGEEIGA